MAQEYVDDVGQTGSWEGGWGLERGGGRRNEYFLRSFDFSGEMEAGLFVTFHVVTAVFTAVFTAVTNQNTSQNRFHTP